MRSCLSEIMDKFEREIKIEERIENLFLDRMSGQLPKNLRNKLDLKDGQNDIAPIGVVLITWEELKDLEKKGLVD